MIKATSKSLVTLEYFNEKEVRIYHVFDNHNRQYCRMANCIYNQILVADSAVFRCCDCMGYYYECRWK